MPDEQTPLLAVVRIEPRRPRYEHSTLRRFCTIALSAALALIVISFLLPVAFLSDTDGLSSSYLPWARTLPNKAWPASDGMAYEELQATLLNTPNEDEARRWSHYYTAGPHLAGRNLSQAVWTREKWEEFGIQSTIVAYDVYLNYPLNHRLALVESGPKGHKIKYECALEEDVLGEDDTTGLKNRIPTFHGYSANGNITSRYIYVNFGTWQDYADLVAANVSLKGKIALAKYGRVFRGLKVKRAQELGMVGVVIYTDPQEDGEMTVANGHKPYPEGPARNPSSVQRGSTQYISAYIHVTSPSDLIDRCFRRSSWRSYNSGNSFKTWRSTRRSP